jgi:hypothetical protein
MMQMLAAGGMEILTDGERQADVENPKGYYEWEPAKLLPQQPQRIQDAEGKAVKIISQLLFALPADRHYQIIFMERRLSEVVASQAEMIRRKQTTGAALSSAAMISALQTHLNHVNAWLPTRANIVVHRVKHAEVLSDPRVVADGVRSFLNCPLDVEAMAAQVDSALYRQRFVS